MSTETNPMFNDHFINAGWVPVSIIAEVFGVTRMTIHRRIEAGDYGDSTTDAHVVYVKLSAVRAYYKGKTVLEARVDALEARVEKIKKEIKKSA